MADTITNKYNFNNISFTNQEEQTNNLYFPRDPTSYLVKGTQAGSTNQWSGNLPDGIDDYYDGLTIDYFLPYDGNGSAVTLNLSSKGETPVYLGNSNTQVTTQYTQYSVIRLTYITGSGLNSGNGAWKASAYFDTNAGGTVTSVSGINGLTGTVTTSGNLSANLVNYEPFSNAAQDASYEANRLYSVRLDSNGKLAVNVPWTNVNPNYITTHQTINQDGMIGALGIHYGTCQSAANAATKVVNLLPPHTNGQNEITNGEFTLNTGSRIIVNFYSTNSADYPKLNVAGTGAKSIKFNGTTISTNEYKTLLSGAIEFIYDGADWLLVGNFIDRAISGVANYTKLGAVKPWKSYTTSSTGISASTSSDAPTINSITTNVDKYYAIEVDKDGRLFVNIPWVDTNTWVANSTLSDGYVSAAETDHRVWGREGTLGWKDPNLLYLDNTSDANLISSISYLGWTSDCIVS
jgi:hypothetical protein